MKNRDALKHKYIFQVYMLSVLCRERFLMQINCFAAKCFSSLSPLTPVAPPSQRETHLWYIASNEVNDAALLTQYQHFLSPSEKESILSMQGEMLQKRALLARALVRSTLSRYTNSQVSPKSLVFRKNPFGKPEVDWKHDENWDPPPLHFNLSHTSSLIACGVSVDVPIGIDMEEKGRKINHNLSSFARRYFSLDEVEYLHAIPDPEVQRQEFIKLWTLKEAYVKALGRGFSAAPFKSFAIRFKDSNKYSLQVPGISSSKASAIIVEARKGCDNITTCWKFALFELATSHYAAICIQDKSMEGEKSDSLKLKVWKTIPFVQDEFVSGTNSVIAISGLT